MRALLVALFVLGAACGPPAPAGASAGPVSNNAPADPEPADTLALVLVVDRSGSMTGMKMDATREAARHLATILPIDAELALIAFDSESTVLVPLTRDPQVIADGIARLDAGGGTNFNSGLVAAHELLVASRAATKHVIFLSDGEAPSAGVVEATTSLREGGATVTAIAIPQADENLLGLIAKAGDGRLISLRDVGRLAETLELELRTVTGR